MMSRTTHTYRIFFLLMVSAVMQYHSTFGYTCPVNYYSKTYGSVFRRKNTGSCFSRGIVSSLNFHSLQNSKRPTSSRDDYYYDDDDYYYDDDDRTYYDEKFVGGSDEEKELKRMAKSSSDDDDYYYSETYEMDRYRPANDENDRRSRSMRMSKRRDQYMDEEWESDEDDDNEDDIVPGNFWSNPQNRMDGSRRSRSSVSRASRERQYRSRDRRDDSRRQPRDRNSYPSNLQAPPPAVKDFYSRMFWYGFDPNEEDGVGDKTVFGGTKGKFNGLSFLQEGISNSEDTKDKRRSPRRKERYDDYYSDEDDEEENDEYYDYDEPTSSNLDVRRPSVKPPNDIPYPRSERRDTPSSGSQRQQRRQRRSRRRVPDYYDDDEGDDDEGYRFYNSRERGNDDEDWISKQVASWFSLDDNDDYSSRENRGIADRRRRRQRSSSSEWSPFNVLDTFFGVDRDEQRYQAEMYDRKMGLGSGSSSSTRRRRASPTPRPQRESRRRGGDTPRRPGYAYRYDRDEDDSSPPVADFDVTAEPVEAEATEGVDESTKIEEEGESSSSRDDIVQANKPGRKSRERTWEERAIAAERVPPANIPAWGPSGELGMDARSKAIMDALEDIQSARRKVELKEKKEEFAREDITILKVDAELQRKRMERNDEETRFAAEERLRDIEFEIDDASRVLRRARSQLQLSQERLEELEERHWALLSLYNADQAEERVSEAFREFQELEPAARIDEFDNTKQQSESSATSDVIDAIPENQQAESNSFEPNDKKLNPDDDPSLK